MIEKNIRVTRWIDGEDRIVTVNDKILSESEIVDLLVEYMAENKELEQENQILKDTIDGLTGTMAHMTELCGDVE